MVWDIGPLRGDLGTPPPPITNTPPRIGVDPHDLVIESEARVRRQIAEFLRIDGRMIDVCGIRPMPRRRVDRPVRLAVARRRCSSRPLRRSADRYVAGAPGAGDPFFPSAGNGGYDVRHYSLDLDYDQPANRLDGRVTIHARATQGLYRFNLDLRDFLTVARVIGERQAAP